ncbi:MAG: 1-acyl-sn-glycerol-3-phosphate acyltransferase [Bacteroidales bacterium]|nr:1-acyl-sn-glycerol-3-phosphate acyltransferase [Bacteroidales bacterium]HOI31766.1 1-acyl-sn-glycerol-3-phosphate acyltransferase [Bacteroidales bacterium]
MKQIYEQLKLNLLKTSNLSEQFFIRLIYSMNIEFPIFQSSFKLMINDTFSVFLLVQLTFRMKEHPQTTQAQTDRLIDIEAVFRQKNPKLFKAIPGFVFQYLKRVIHQDQINDFIQRSKHLYGLDFVDAAITEFNPTVIIHGHENIPVSDRIIVASNHPLGGLDGIALMQAVGRVRPDIQFPVNDILLYVDNLKPLFIPINKHGSNAENIRILNDTFAGDKVICYFPFGLVSRKKGGRIYDLEWKKTFLSKAKKYKRNIVPVHIVGRNSGFFYNLSNFRKFLGIKANIEMLYLADEFFKQYNKKIIITFGKPIDYKVFDKRNTDQEWATQLRNYSYRLSTNPNEIFNPETSYTLY